MTKLNPVVARSCFYLDSSRHLPTITPTTPRHPLLPHIALGQLCPAFLTLNIGNIALAVASTTFNIIAYEPELFTMDSN